MWQWLDKPIGSAEKRVAMWAAVVLLVIATVAGGVLAMCAVSQRVEEWHDRKSRQELARKFELLK